MGTMPRRTPPASIRVKHYTSAPSPEVFAAGASRPSGANPYAAASGQGASASTPPQRKPWLLPLLGHALVRAGALVLLACTALLVWLHLPGSLATAVQWITPLLPAGQQIEAQGVQGSLRHGGRMASLRWSGPGLQVQAQDVQIAWDLATLLQGRVVLSRLEAAQLALAHTPQPSPAQRDTTAPTQLGLPLRVDMPAHIGQIVWNGQPLAQDLQAHYRYDGSTHRLELAQLQVAQGRYQASGTLQAQAPMALDVQAQGQVHTTTPTGQDLVLQAQARLQGPLAGADALLRLQARLQPDTARAPTTHSTAQIDATVAPWAAQPLRQAQAKLQALDLAILWPQAPHTALQGNVQVQPEGAGWQIEAQLSNPQHGPWDQQRLPLQALQASAHYDGTLWELAQARLQAGSGHMTLQGRYHPADKALEGSAQLHAFNPALLHSDWAPQPLSGSLLARQNATGLDWRVDLQADARRTAPGPGLRLDHARAQGRWHDRTLQIDRLDLQALQARVQSPGLELRWADAPQARGRLTLALPGASAQASGHWSAHSGAGQAQVDVQQAAQVQAWLRSLPGLPPGALDAGAAQGQARLDMRWQGGWKDGLAVPTGTGRNAPSPPPQLEATLSAPRLEWMTRAADNPAATTVQWRDVQARFRGNAAQALLDLDAQALTQGQRLRLQTRLSGGQKAPAGDSPATAAWHAQIATLQLTAQPTAAGAGQPWLLALAEPLPLALHTEPGPTLALQADAGSAHLSGPQPGRTLLRWEPQRLRTHPTQPWQWQSRGTLEGLPLAWLAALAPPSSTPWPATAQGVAPLLLKGRWDTEGGARPRLDARLQHESGDLPLPLIETSAAPQSAGVRALAVQLETDGTTLSAQLHWDSARAGTLELQASTQIARTDQGWLWPEQAPVAAQMNAQLPQLGVWSALAPPGWRVQGTLDTQATLSGTRSQPRWHGKLAADGFALRSVLDGVDLRDGRLRATLQGDRIAITELQLHGSPGGGAHIPGYSGNRTPPPRDGGRLEAQGHVTWVAGQGLAMDLNAQAHALQVLARADRQASVSGKVRATLAQGQVRLQGQLRADRAALLLPDANAPRLGSDVVVHRADDAPRRDAAAPARRTLPAAQVELRLDLGDDFAVQGHGITTRLGGQVEVQSGGPGGAALRVTGEVRTVQGRYRAWGQMLDVESGLIRFNGAYDNPALDILALRPQISTRAGVQVQGTAQAPRVRLYADPERPDAEKLALVVLGRSASSGTAEAVLLQQAAWALLGSKGTSPTAPLASRLGLDELGVQTTDGSNGASSAALTLGKRLSQDLYLSYERSLSGAMGTLYIFYDLSRHLTLRAQTGEKAALDLIYTRRFD
jgi:translocation and assembly module TamB